MNRSSSFLFRELIVYEREIQKYNNHQALSSTSGGDGGGGGGGSGSSIITPMAKCFLDGKKKDK